MDLGLLFAAATGGLFLALGVMVWRITRRDAVPDRRAATRAFALFCMSYGSANVAQNAGSAFGTELSTGIGYTLGGIGLVVATPALVRVALLFPRRLARADALSVGAPALLALAFFGAIVVGSPPSLDGGWSDRAAQISTTVFFGFIAVLWGALLLLAIRHAREPADDARRQLVLIAAALVVWPAVIGAMSDVRGMFALATVSVATLVAIAWLAAGGRSVAFVALGATLAAVAVEAAGRNFGLIAISRIIAVSIIAFAILRHQVFGLDVRVRWGVARGALAAAFVGAFFVSTELAQNVLGSAYGPVWGAVAAGLLLFALAPLQRAADALARRAVPSDAIPSGAPASRREEVYRKALRVALRDRAITREEETHLHEVAEELGIGAGRAHALMVEVEREAQGGERA